MKGRVGHPGPFAAGEEEAFLTHLPVTLRWEQSARRGTWVASRHRNGRKVEPP